ncbi:MAG: sulfatase-like hydrolase/transferase, partial [Bacteroidota bacterium]
MNFQKIIVLVLLCLGTRSCKEKEGDAKKESSPSRPNIVLIMADDQGWGDLRIHGNTNLNTPHIDALAKNGVSFENFFVQPVCSPTRAEVLTGLHFPRIGVYDTSAGGERMDSEVPTLAHILKDVGYATAAYGKWHNGMQPPYHP